MLDLWVEQRPTLHHTEWAFQTKAEAARALQINNDQLLYHITLARKQDLVFNVFVQHPKSA